jgi:hypothetical protein
MAKEKLTHKRLVSILDYNSSTGVFKWLDTRRGRVNIGDKAGSLQEDGYIRIRVDGVLYYAHVLAWFYCYKKFPTKQIDHINNKRHINKISNLREATRSQNAHNSKKRAKNKSGYKGVRYYKRLGKYVAQITVKYKKHHLGYFKTAKEAHAAYCKAARTLHGKFSRTA